MEENKEVYEQKAIVEAYCGETALQAPEKTILELLKPSISDSKMLDIGIGGGRTSIHFAPLVQHYTGIDYSKSMIDYCLGAHAGLANAVFSCVDARYMSDFKDESFDLILFSFNGIDSVNKEDRNKIFREVLRVGKQGAIFVFSSHNTMNLALLYSFQTPRNPLNYSSELRRLRKVKEINGPIEQYAKEDWFIIKDGGGNFELDTFYIHPQLQVKQLQETGFKDVDCFDLKHGQKLDTNELKIIADPWIYYMCKISKKQSQ